MMYLLLAIQTSKLAAILVLRDKIVFCCHNVIQNDAHGYVFNSTFICDASQTKSSCLACLGDHLLYSKRCLGLYYSHRMRGLIYQMKLHATQMPLGWGSYSRG